MAGRHCIAIAGASGAGKSDLSRRIEGALVLEMDDYFRDYQTPEYYLREEWDTPVAYDFALLEKQVSALLEGKEVTLARFNFLTGCREQGEMRRLPADGTLVVEGLYAFRAKIPYSARIYMETTYPQMVERCLPRDQEKRGRRDLKKLLAMYEQSWRKYEKDLFPQRDEADIILGADWASRLPTHLRFEDLAELTKS